VNVLFFFPNQSHAMLGTLTLEMCLCDCGHYSPYQWVYRLETLNRVIL